MSYYFPSYDPQLRAFLPATTAAGGVLNSLFVLWAGHIEKALEKRTEIPDRYYEEDPDQTLIEACKEHIQEHRQPIEAPNVLVLTHPFYLQLSHYRRVLDEKKRIADRYRDTLMAVLRARKGCSLLGVVALETLHHYAAATSLLLEKGLVDDVILTEYDNGAPLNSEDLRIILSGRRLYFAGGYNGRCLATAIDTAYKQVRKKKIFAVPELISESPLYEHNRLPEVEGVPKKDVILLEQALNEWGIML